MNLNISRCTKCTLCNIRIDRNNNYIMTMENDKTNFFYVYKHVTFYTVNYISIPGKVYYSCTLSFNMNEHC